MKAASASRCRRARPSAASRCAWATAGRRARSSSSRRRASPTKTSCTGARTRRCWRPRPATSSRRGSSRSRRAATKELIVSYSQELTRTSEPYRLPLRGLPKVNSLSIRALIGKTISGAAGAPASSLGGARVQRELVEVNKRDFRPDRDFEVAHTGDRGRLGLRDQNLVVARIVPFADSERRDDVSSLLVLIDTSASRALGLGEQIAAWDNLVAELRKGRGRSDADDSGVRPGGRADLHRSGKRARRRRAPAHHRAARAGRVGPRPRAALGGRQHAGGGEQADARPAGHRRRRHRRRDRRRRSCASA